MVIENERSGYIVQTFNRFDTVHLLANDLFDTKRIGNIWDYMEESWGIAEPLYRYKIYGNMRYMAPKGHCISACTNGSFSVYVLKIDPKTFSIKQFIKERQNSLVLLDSWASGDEDEKIFEFILRFE